MLDLIGSLLTGRVGATLSRFTRLAIFAALTFLFAVAALAAGAAALFLALSASLGAIRAALVLAGGAAILAALASIPLWGKSKPPPPSTAATLVELALAVGLGLLAERKGKKDRE